jgi:hypothetical protein
LTAFLAGTFFTAFLVVFFVILKSLNF